MPDAEQEQEAPGGPWTQHGASIPGITVAGAGRPPIHRCLGLRGCRQCMADAERIRSEREDLERTRTDLTAELERIAAGVVPPDAEIRAGEPRPAPDLELVWRHPLFRVIEQTIIEHTTVRTEDGPIRACGCGKLKLGQSWTQHVAELLLPALLDHSPTIDGWALVPTLAKVGQPAPNITFDPLQAERASRAALFLRLQENAERELSKGHIVLHDESRLNVVTLTEVLEWLSGLSVRARNGADL